MTANIWKALPYHLIHNAGLVALIVDRVYPLRLPQTTTLPAICFQDISTVATQGHKEPSVLPRARFQFTIYAGTVESVDAVGKALKTAIDGYKGNMGAGSYITKVEACLFKNEITNDDPETLLPIKLQDYIIQYKE